MQQIVRVVFVVALLGLVSSAMAQGLQPVEQDRRIQNFMALTKARMDGIRSAILELQGLLSKVDNEAGQELQKLIAQVKAERERAAKAAEAKAQAKAKADEEAKAKATATVEGPQPIPMDPK